MDDIRTGPLAHARDLVRPRLRGVVHQWAALVAAVLAVVLVALPQHPGMRWSTAVYGTVLVGLFAVSATYHRVTWTTARARALMRRADHSMIAVFIAGTSTPLCLAVLRGRALAVVLGLAWAGAAVVVAAALVFPHAPRWVTVPLYVASAWAAVYVVPGLLAHSTAAGVLLLVGGGVYVLGALCYATRRPTLRPATFGYHEGYHVATVVAAVLHFVSVCLVVVA